MSSALKFTHLIISFRPSPVVSVIFHGVIYTCCRWQDKKTKDRRQKRQKTNEKKEKTKEGRQKTKDTKEKKTNVRIKMKRKVMGCELVGTFLLCLLPSLIIENQTLANNDSSRVRHFLFSSFFFINFVFI